jgi:hypothetical protein
MLAFQETSEPKLMNYVSATYSVFSIAKDEKLGTSATSAVISYSPLSE